jgi:hypothetical protein
MLMGILAALAAIIYEISKNLRGQFQRALNKMRIKSTPRRLILHPSQLPRLSLQPKKESPREEENKRRHRMLLRSDRRLLQNFIEKYEDEMRRHPDDFNLWMLTEQLKISTTLFELK